MDREIAQVLATSASRIATDLSYLMPFLNEYGDGAKDDATRFKIASAIAEVQEIYKAAFTEYPDLRKEFDERVKKYGRPSY